MRKMSEVKCVWGLKLAAAALAVAGVVGTASAQSPFDPINAADAYPGTATMGVGYEIIREAKIVVTAKNPKKADIWDVDPKKTEVSGPLNGNLGQIQVTTNSTGWDVLLSTDNGGRLRAGTRTAGTITSVWDNGCMCIKPDTQWTVTGVNLKYSDNSEVPLKVAIGMLDNINGTTKVLKGIPSQDVGPAAYAAAEVDDDKLKVSNVLTTPVSFIETLSGITVTEIGDGLRVGGVKAKGTAVGTATQMGFGETGPEYYPAASGVKRDGSEWFFVNVGIDSKKSGGTEKISGNAEGNYTETFTFTLKALF